MLVVLLIAIFFLAANGFVARAPWGTRTASTRVLMSEGTGAGSAADDAPKSKGFGKPVEKKVELVEDDAGTRTYKSQAKRGVPEYNIFMRPLNGSIEEWVPVGSMTIPRDTPVGKAVYDVEVEMLKGTFKLYPKLKAFAETRATKDGKGLFEYGYIMKAFPDEEIKIIPSPESMAEEANGKNFFQRWLDSVTNPLDGTDIKNKGSVTLKQ